MKDLTNPNWIKAKGILFLFLGLLSAGLLFLDHPSWKAALLLALAVWCFLRFSGLWSFARHLVRGRKKRP